MYGVLNENVDGRRRRRTGRDGVTVRARRRYSETWKGHRMALMDGAHIAFIFEGMGVLLGRASEHDMPCTMSPGSGQS